jgi:uncharacterized protein (TIGR03032 family)
MARSTSFSSAPVSPDPIEGQLQQIVQLGQAGKIAEAERRCQRLVQQFPKTASGWDLFGLIALQQGEFQAALYRLQRAIELKADRAEFHDHLGVAYCGLGELELGVAAYQQALTLNPQAAHTRYNLGLAWQKLGQWQEALQTYQHLIAQHPTHALAHFQLGNLWQQQQQFSQSIRYYQQAVQHQPQYTEAWYNLGVALQQIGEWRQAFQSYQQALSLKPSYAEALNGLGTLLDKQGNAIAALNHYQQALALQPDYVHALMNLGNLQVRLEQLPAAEITYRRVLQLDADNIQALDALLKIQLQQCQWSDWMKTTADLKARIHDRLRQGLPCNISPLNSLFLPFSAAEQQAIARSHAEKISARMQNVWRQKGEIGNWEWGVGNSGNRKIRLGYVSGDFRYHAVGHLILQLFELHDRQRFEVFAYSLGPNDGSAERQKLESDCDYFCDISCLSPSQAAQQIYDNQIDILIDLAGYTDYACSELFALRPAPIQVNYLGYPGTLGADYIDYLITDAITTPKEDIETITESCIYLPNCYQLNSYLTNNFDNHQSIAETDLPPDLLPFSFVFCCFNKSQKIEPQIFAAWMRILAQVPQSGLWLLSDRPETEANLKREAATQGIDPDRLVFAPRVKKAAHLARHSQAHLFLDTLHYNAHVTASDALWSGVPLITVMGKTFASRVAASLLTAVGLPELITSSLDEYERLAIYWATHPHEYQQLRAKLATHRSRFPLFDTARTVRNLETGYQQIWQRFQSGQAPATLWVEEILSSEAEAFKDRQSQWSPIVKPETQNTDNLINPATVVTTSALTLNPSPSGSGTSDLASLLPEKEKGLGDEGGSEGKIKYGRVNKLVIAPSPHVSLPFPETIACRVDDGFCQWLSRVDGSLILSTYQAGKVILIGWNGQQVTILPRDFPKPMGIAVAGDRLALATQQEVLLFANASVLAAAYVPDQPGRYDALYLPRVTYRTGDLHIHDLAYGDEGLWFVNTRFSCLAQIDPEFTFIPRWQPSFISQLVPEDRCHLNGLAIADGRPKYVTALGHSDTCRGWQDNKAMGGVVIDVATGEVWRSGLSMPHSPRWYQGKLWLLNSGAGEVWQVDPETGHHQVVCVLPGFGRGLCLVDNYALIGLSQVRETSMFGDLPIQTRFDRLRCGVVIVDLRTGLPIGQLEFIGGCRELYDIAYLANQRRPTLLNANPSSGQQAITTPDFAYWLRSVAQET